MPSDAGRGASVVGYIPQRYRSNIMKMALQFASVETMKRSRPPAIKRLIPFECYVPKDVADWWHKQEKYLSADFGDLGGVDLPPRCTRSKSERVRLAFEWSKATQDWFQAEAERVSRVEGRPMTIEGLIIRIARANLPMSPASLRAMAAKQRSAKHGH